jgi:hypothetical protein
MAFLYLRSLLDTHGHHYLSFSQCFLLRVQCVQCVQCVHEYSSYIVERCEKNTINSMGYRRELFSSWTPDTWTQSK